MWGIAAAVAVGAVGLSQAPHVRLVVAGRQPAALALTKLGYEAVPLRRYRDTWMLDTTLAGKPLALLVDTGAAMSCLDRDTAPAKYGVRPWGRKEVALLVSGAKPADFTTVTGLKLGRLVCPPQTWFLTTLDTAFEFGRYPDNRAGDAVLGMDLLGYFSAWLDTDAGVLWLLDPVKDEPGIQGEWRVVSVERPGGAFTQLLDTTYMIHVDGMTATWWVQREKEVSKLRVNTSTQPKQLDLSDQTGDWWRGIYKLDGDTLTVAMAWCEGDSRDRPKSFDVTANKTTVITFRRFKPGPPPR